MCSLSRRPDWPKLIQASLRACLSSLCLRWPQAGIQSSSRNRFWAAADPSFFVAGTGGAFSCSRRDTAQADAIREIGDAVRPDGGLRKALGCCALLIRLTAVVRANLAT